MRTSVVVLLLALSSLPCHAELPSVASLDDLVEVTRAEALLHDMWPQVRVLVEKVHTR